MLEFYPPERIVGKRFRITISGGTGIFAGQGTYDFVPDTTGDGYRILGGIDVPDSFGTYSYTRTGPANARIDFSDSLVGAGFTQVLTFMTQTSGSFVLLRDRSSGEQKGSFRIID